MSVSTQVSAAVKFSPTPPAFNERRNTVTGLASKSACCFAEMRDSPPCSVFLLSSSLEEELLAEDDHEPPPFRLKASTRNARSSDAMLPSSRTKRKPLIISQASMTSRNCVYCENMTVFFGLPSASVMVRRSSRMDRIAFILPPLKISSSVHRHGAGSPYLAACWWIWKSDIPFNWETAQW